MSWVLAGLALLAAMFAVLEARRARTEAGAAPTSAPPPPPPPPPPPAGADEAARERLDRLEGEREASHAELRSLAGAVSHLEEALQAARRQTEALRGELDAARASTARADEEPDGDEAPTPEEQVRAFLTGEGWEEIVLLPDAAGGPVWRVEARREGAIQKGRARLFPDGRVEARLTSPTRAFP